MTRPRPHPLPAALALTLALAGSLAACGGGGDDATGPTPVADITGVYPLRTLNGAPLPLLVDESPTEGKLEVTSGHVTLKGDGTFAEGLSYRLTRPGVGAAVEVDSSTSSGRYSVTAGQIVFTFPNGVPVTATFVSGTITVVGQATFVYRR